MKVCDSDFFLKKRYQKYIIDPHLLQINAQLIIILDIHSDSKPLSCRSITSSSLLAFRKISSD